MSTQLSKDDLATATLAANDRARRVEQFPAQRHAEILRHLRSAGTASVQELSESLGASLSTVRRDLDALAAKGHVERTHGGASLPRAPGIAPEVESAVASHIAHREKVAIGALAASLIQPHQTVIFDSGTTVMEAAKAVATSAIPLRAVTNDLAIAQALGRQPAISVIVAGGTLRHGSQTLLGNPGPNFLSTLYADLAFVGAHAVTDDVLSDSSLELADMKRAMIASGKRSIILADSGKFGSPSSFAVCKLNAIDEIISDEGLTSAMRAELESYGVTLSLAAIDG